MTETVKDTLAKFPWRYWLWLSVATPLVLGSMAFLVAGLLPEHILVQLQSGLNEALRRSDSWAFEPRAEVTLILATVLNAAWTICLPVVVALSRRIRFASNLKIPLGGVVALTLLLLPSTALSWWQNVDDLWRTNVAMSWGGDGALLRLLLAFFIGVKFMGEQGLVVVAVVVIKAAWGNLRLGTKGADPTVSK